MSNPSLCKIQHVAMPSSTAGEHDAARHSHTDSMNTNFSSRQILHTKSIDADVGDDVEHSAADNLKSLVQECGVSPHKISELLQELPQLRVSDALIDYYFSSM